MEHIYPKYDYSDYDEMEDTNDEDEEEAGEDTDRSNSGLSQRLHPFLRVGDTDSDLQRYSSPPVAQSFHSYKPGLLSSYSSSVGSLEEHMNASLSAAPLTNERRGSIDSDESNSELSRPPSADLNDFYAAMKADRAAILW